MSIDDFEDINTDQAFTKKSLYGRANEMTYGGALSFLRRKYTKELKGVDIAVSGILMMLQLVSGQVQDLVLRL